MLKLQVLCAAVLACTGVNAAGRVEEERSSLPVTPLAKILRDARAYHGKEVHLQGASCVDKGKGGFVCVLTEKGRPVMISASALGAETITDIAEDLIGPCKGTANLGSRECRFNIQIKPTNSAREMIETTAGSQQVISIYSATIDMYRPN